VLSPGYETSTYGSIPQFIKSGSGRKTLILIPGMGFDASVFNDFMLANGSRYLIYAITIPGYGKTMAPPMPLTDTSYGDQNWNKGVIAVILKLIDQEKINDPVIVGHFVQGSQLALQMAISYPDKIAGVVILGGPAKFIFIDKGVPKNYPLKNTIAYIDKITAPTWFKTISQENFNAGNYLPEIYSLDSMKGKELWKSPAVTDLPVIIRYLCEFFASDVTLELQKIKCPVLVLRAGFNDHVLQNSINNYVKPQFIDSWTEASTSNPLITIKLVPNAGSFVWKDQPSMVYDEINHFLQAN
jgi:pimeloyl-ACP methyl ester carboxylesterase